MAPAPLPATSAALASTVAVNRRHPGLQLDRLSIPVRQEGQRRLLDDIVDAAADPVLLSVLLRRRERVLTALRARRLSVVTTTPLTLHLARRAALENVGLALHPIYGFVYIPGTGLKGLTKAWATTVWLQSQPNRRNAQTLIKDVFGWQPESAEHEPWAADEGPVDDPLKQANRARAGCLIFHDAWPTSWPRLTVDTTTSHHRDYYGRENPEPPGDWEDPVPVSFLCVAAGQGFSCAVAPAGSESTHLETVLEWMSGALAWLGAGAKTNAGYGTMEPARDETVRVQPPGEYLQCYENTIRLVTPAFLAGADQTSLVGCDLRSATVRGLLRQWWRTRHAGFVDTATLRHLEACIWGDTEQGGAVRTVITRETVSEARMFDHKDGFRPTAQFKREHDLQDPPPLTTQGLFLTTQGLFYVSYGMDDGGKRRPYAQPGSTWRIRLSARESHFGPEKIPIGRDVVLGEALAALWQLATYGGVGAKNRKGFGSFVLDTPLDLTLDEVRSTAARFREICGVDGEFEETLADSFSLNQIERVEVATPWTDPWFALDQLGAAVQTFTRAWSHRREKGALGLPRQIHGPRREPMRHQSAATFQRPERLSATRNGVDLNRHAAPVFYHLEPGSGGGLTIGVTTFTARHLPDPATSAAVLTALRGTVATELSDRSRAHGAIGRGRPGQAAAGVPARRGPALKSGTSVECRLLEERTKAGGWKAEHVETRLKGHILNSERVPADKQPGNTVTLLIASVSADGKTLTFRWPA